MNSFTGIYMISNYIKARERFEVYGESAVTKAGYDIK